MAELATQFRQDIAQKRAELAEQFVGSSEYIEQFTQSAPHEFAVIKIGGAIIGDPEMLEDTAADLVTLQEVGLTPVVVHGGKPQIEKELAERGLETVEVNGLRVTERKHMAAVYSGLLAANQALAKAVTDHGGLTNTVCNVFGARMRSGNNMAAVESIETVDIDRIVEPAERGEIPIVMPNGHVSMPRREAEPININADISAAELGIRLGVRKFISLTRGGSIMNEGQPLDSLGESEARGLIRSGVIDAGARPKVEEALRLVNNGIHDVVITKPEDLLTELFTNEGAGTMIHADDR